MWLVITKQIGLLIMPVTCWCRSLSPPPPLPALLEILPNSRIRFRWPTNVVSSSGFSIGIFLGSLSWTSHAALRSKMWRCSWAKGLFSSVPSIECPRARNCCYGRLRDFAEVYVCPILCIMEIENVRILYWFCNINFKFPFQFSNFLN